MSVYILQKDTVAQAHTKTEILKAGLRFNYEDKNQYVNEEGDSRWWFHKDFVENNPEWFKPENDYTRPLMDYKDEWEKMTKKYSKGNMDIFKTEHNKKYNYSFAELIDRLNIVQMKSFFAKEGKEKFQEEISNILHDIQLGLDEGVVVTADIIRAIVVLTQSNLSLWMNEDFIRTGEQKERINLEELAGKLIHTHKLNGTRSIAKTRIQNLIGGRTDPKINCLAENSAWDIKW